MPIIVKDSGDFVLAPEGQHQAVCCDVLELRNVQTQYGLKTKIKMIFELDGKREDGKPHMVSRTFGATLSSQGLLRPFLESWRGQKFTAEELKEFDLENLLGVNGVIQVLHETKNEKTYANIQSVMRLMQGMEPMKVTEGYVRVQDRPTEDTNGGGPGHPDHGELPPPDDDLPF